MHAYQLPTHLITSLCTETIIIQYTKSCLKKLTEPNIEQWENVCGGVCKAHGEGLEQELLGGAIIGTEAFVDVRDVGHDRLPVWNGQSHHVLNILYTQHTHREKQCKVRWWSCIYMYISYTELLHIIVCRSVEISLTSSDGISSLSAASKAILKLRFCMFKNIH